MKDLVVITGGNSGLGFELAKKYAKEGYAIYIIGLDENKLYFANKYLRDNFDVDVYSFCGNIANEEFVKKVFANINKEKYNIKCVINAAGKGAFCDIEDVTFDIINKNIEANLIGLMLTCTEAIKYMNKNGGTIINVMSTASLKGNSTEAAYCAAKWGAKGYTKSLQDYTKGTNIDVVAVYPGEMQTSFWNNECGKYPNTSTFMKPEAVANKIFNILTDSDGLKVSKIVIERK